jgi:hypothetical protein
MALLQLLSEEEIAEDSIHGYFEDLYRIVCVSERPASLDQPSGLLRTTYVVDWEQLVHLLEDYTYFGEDIVEVSAIRGDEARVIGPTVRSRRKIARA